MSHAYEAELNVALEAVRRAGRLCQAVRRELDPETLEKKDRSPVTIADFGSQALVCQTLSEHFASDPVIAEEDSAELQTQANAPILERVVEHVCSACGSSPSAATVCEWIDRGSAKQHCPRYWTLDPIDGTKGFLRADQYAVALALVINGLPTVAALACPNLPVDPEDEASEVGAIFTAVRGYGAQVHAMSAEAGTPGRPIKVTRTDDATAARFCESVESGHSSHSDSARVAELLGITQPSRRLDSQAKYAVVARGEADIYMRLPTRADYREKIWDHAAGVLVVQEAGGTATDINGKVLEFTHGSELVNNRGVLVTNSSLHSQVLAALRDAGVGGGGNV
ncbi:MAG: 3'(2'),5'-bisphosphate nucleotidase [Phycisphaeraceae bacterium]